MLPKAKYKQHRAKEGKNKQRDCVKEQGQYAGFMQNGGKQKLPHPFR
jgi:hypothetical protein